MSAMFLAMVWHAQRRQAALAEVQGVAEMRASLLERQERFLHDASHELRTPVTIARGHLELLRREQPDSPELEVALDELGRMERIVERLLLLAKSEQQGFALRGDRPRGVPLRPLHPLVGGRSARLAARRRSRGAAARGSRGAAGRARRAARERGQVHEPGRRRRARGARGRSRRSRDRGLGLGPRHSARGSPAHLRPLGARGRRAHPGARRGGTRACDRRRGRARSRRPLLGEAAAARDGVPAPPSRAHCS